MMNRNKLHERKFDFEIRSVQTENENNELWAEGYAAKFESPTILFESKNLKVVEQINRGAFDSANMKDVIFNYNHSGKVMARTRNQTLQLFVDDVGLLIRARLDGTDEGRKLYQEIQGGYIDRMSFRFSIEDEKYIESSDTVEFQITKIKKLYDVSAVDIPAYDDTSIEARRASVEEILEKRKHTSADAEAEYLLAVIRTKL
jgi:HK97 family phage prohead protease